MWIADALTPERSFLLLAGVFGVFFCFFTPPHDPADEAKHHARAWLIGEGRLDVIGTKPGHAASVPRSIVRLHARGHHYSEEQLRSGHIPAGTRRAPPHQKSEIEALHDRPLAVNDRIEVRYAGAYNPVVYAPAVAALWLARQLDLSAVGGLLLARLFGLAAWCLGIFAALRIAPSQRWLLCGVALLPMSVFQAASISADPLSQVAIFVWFAVLLRGASLPVLLGAALGVGLAKPGYAPLALASFWLPGEPASLGRRSGVALAALAAATLPTLAWAYVLADAGQPALVPGADSAGQLTHILRHPFDFLALVGRISVALLPSWLEGMVGNLGHLDVEIPGVFSALGLAALVASAGIDRGGLGRGLRLGWLAVSAVCALAILMLAYMGWNPVGAPRIQGVQGRYFLLMLPFALVALPGLPFLREDRLRIAIVATLLAVLAVSAERMLDRYYA
ncbi:MAG: DUF2142 domain-containing protein [Myxococcota bacterium]